jgi:hypothetical protein
LVTDSIVHPRHLVDEEKLRLLRLENNGKDGCMDV